MWDDRTQSVYLVDLFGEKITRYDYATKTIYKASVEGKNGFVGVVSPVADDPDHYYVSSGGELYIAEWDGESSTANEVGTIITVDPDMNVNSFLVTPQNDFLIGGFDSAFCKSQKDLSLFEYDRNNQLTPVIDGFIANVGLAMNEEEQLVYQLDPCTYNLVEYDYSPENGSLSEFEFNDVLRSKEENGHNIF